MITPSVILSKLSRNSSKERVADPQEQVNWGLNNSYHPQILENREMKRELITSRIRGSEKGPLKENSQ